VSDLGFIEKAQQLGFSLNEIRELFAILLRMPLDQGAHAVELSRHAGGCGFLKPAG